MSIDVDKNESGHWLAIDCSTSSMTVAVLNNGHLLGESNSRAERNHSIHLLPTIRQLLKSLDLQMRDLNGIAVGQGPGSYTGVRIGVTVAKTFAWALSVPLVGVSSLEALAHGGFLHEPAEADVVSKSQGRHENVWLVPLMDARRGQVYTGLYLKNREAWECLYADGIRPMDQWMNELIEHLAGNTGPHAGDVERAFIMPDRIAFVGEFDPFIQSVDRLKERFSGEVFTMGLDLRAYDVGIIALGRWARGEQQDVHSFVPNYTQLPEAEKNLLSKTKGRE